MLDCSLRAQLKVLQGILISGATFSVLDPLYPPDRQVIYLDVSKPRGLIILQRATEEAGPLTQKVKDFIVETLEVVWRDS